MICEKCGINKAVIHNLININGNQIESHLCENCSQPNNVFNSSDFYYDDSYTNKACNVCGYTLDNFKESGLLGCGNCYKTFYSVIESDLVKIQPSTMHRGKKAMYTEDLSDDQKKIALLELELKQAVNEENYELASLLKKQIIELKEAINE